MTPADSSRSPLRVGVMLDGMRVPAWSGWVLGAVAAHEHLHLALAVVCDGSVPEPRPALFRLYEALDRRLFRPQPDALEPVDISPTLCRVPRVHAPLVPAVGSDRRLRDEDVAAVRRASLDVLLRLGDATPRGGILSAARHGVWSWHFGDPVRYRGEPPLFWELSLPEAAAVSVLEVVTDGPGPGTVIYRSAASTDPVSLQRTRNSVYWKSARFALRRLEDLEAGRWRPEPAATAAPPAPDRAAPSTADTVRHLARLARRHGWRKLRSASLERQWFLGLRRRRPEVLPYEDSTPWQVVLPPDDRSWADPFVVEHDAETFVFLEQLRFANGKGELAVGRVEPDGRLTGVEPVLSADHHLSYPYILRDAGRVFMVPESGEARRLDLWTATDFPLRWERAATLLEGVSAVDASIVRHGDLYWMWVNTAVPGARVHDEAWLYFSDRLEAGWTAHPRNPVVSDARRARSGGRPFLHGDMLVRPAQDCTGRYGSRLVFNAVEVLTPDDYHERTVGALPPSWAPGRNLCAHTYTFDGRWEATDGLRRIPRWRAR